MMVFIQLMITYQYIFRIHTFSSKRNIEWSATFVNLNTYRLYIMCKRLHYTYSIVLCMVLPISNNYIYNFCHYETTNNNIDMELLILNKDEQFIGIKKAVLN